MEFHSFEWQACSVLIMDISIKSPSLTDGASMWRLVRDSQQLDVNSTYLYCLLGEHFSDTCAFALVNQQAVAFVTAYRLPQQPHVLFIWQIAVAPSFRGRGIAKQLLQHLTQQPWFAEISEIQATVSPSNVASAALFRYFAQQLSAQVQVTPFLESAHLSAEHEAEPLWRILLPG